MFSTMRGIAPSIVATVGPVRLTGCGIIFVPHKYSRRPGSRLAGCEYCRSKHTNRNKFSGLGILSDSLGVCFQKARISHVMPTGDGHRTYLPFRVMDKAWAVNRPLAWSAAPCLVVVRRSRLKRLEAMIQRTLCPAFSNMRAIRGYHTEAGRVPIVTLMIGSSTLLVRNSMPC